MPLAQKRMFRKFIFSENLLFLKKKKSLQWWESRRKTLLYQPRSWWEILLLIYLFVQVRAINDRLTGSLKENQTQKRWTQVKETQKSFLPAWMLFLFPAFTLTSLQLFLLQREIWKEVTIFNPAMQPHGVQPDRVLFEMSPSRPFNTFFPSDLHIKTILTCQRGKTTYYFPLYWSSRQLLPFGSFLLGQIAISACTAYVLCVDQPRYRVRCSWQETACSF